jgi:hypothetical protein
MVVSHYFVDVILICGLVVGTFGVFYFSNGLFGRVGNLVLKWLLIVSPVWVYMVAFAIVALVSAPSFGKQVDLPVLGFLYPAAAILLTFYLGIMFSRAVFQRLQYPKAPTWRMPKKHWSDVATLVGLFLGFVLANVLIGHLNLVYAIILSLGTAIVVEFASDALSVVIAITVFRASNMNDRQVQLIGLALTLLGIATQFVQPMLDLLGIPIR